jgi:hypothetical protein
MVVDGDLMVVESDLMVVDSDLIVVTGDLIVVTGGCFYDSSQIVGFQRRSGGRCA